LLLLMIEKAKRIGHDKIDDLIQLTRPATLPSE
jgi:hypothetical protein